MNLTPEQREAYKAEVVRRKLAIDDFSRYRAFMHEDYQEWSYITPLNDLLKRCYSGDCKRAMVFFPPQHGKTAAVSEDFPAYCIGRNPKLSMVGCAYDSDRAADYGEAVRDQVNSREFRNLFKDVTLSPDSQAKDRWNVTVGDRKLGGYFAAGVNTALTGRKGDIMIIDDPFKDREDADSELQREKVWKWYHSVFRTRLAPHGVIIIVCTRWHWSDLAGRLLESQPGQWEILNIPAEAGDDDILGRSPGEFLSESKGGSRYARADYEDLKNTMPPTNGRHSSSRTRPRQKGRTSSASGSTTTTGCRGEAPITLRQTSPTPTRSLQTPASSARGASTRTTTGTLLICGAEELPPTSRGAPSAPSSKNTSPTKPS